MRVSRLLPGPADVLRPTVTKKYPMEFIMARQWILFLTAGLVLVTTPGLGDENADAAGNALTEAIAEAA